MARSLSCAGRVVSTSRHLPEIYIHDSCSLHLLGNAPAISAPERALSQKCLVSVGANHYVAVGEFRTLVAVYWSVGVPTRGRTERVPMLNGASR